MTGARPTSCRPDVVRMLWPRIRQPTGALSWNPIRRKRECLHQAQNFRSAQPVGPRPAVLLDHTERGRHRVPFLGRLAVKQSQSTGDRPIVSFASQNGLETWPSCLVLSPCRLTSLTWTTTSSQSPRPSCSSMILRQQHPGRTKRRDMSPDSPSSVRLQLSLKKSVSSPLPIDRHISRRTTLTSHSKARSRRQRRFLLAEC